MDHCTGEKLKSFNQLLQIWITVWILLLTWGLVGREREPLVARITVWFELSGSSSSSSSSLLSTELPPLQSSAAATLSTVSTAAAGAGSAILYT